MFEQPPRRSLAFRPLIVLGMVCFMLWSSSVVYLWNNETYRHLTQQLDVEPGRIILAGRSLGSAVAIEPATRVESAGVLLLSAIDSIPATGARIYPWAPVALLSSQRFDSMSKAPRVRVPVLQVHAANDRMVPLHAARGLFRRFPGRKNAAGATRWTQRRWL